MAINTTKVSELPLVGDIQDFEVFGVDKATNQSAKANMEQLRGNKGDPGEDAPLSNNPPAMNGIASAGTSQESSRDDHVHPRDTGVAGGDLTGNFPSPAIANGAVTASKLAAGVIPSSLPPSGNAGGNLTGTYPNPTIANGAVTASKLAAGVIPSSLPPSGSAGGDLTGTYPNPTIGTGKVTPEKLSQAYLPLSGGTMSGVIRVPNSPTGGIADSGGSLFVLTDTSREYFGSQNLKQAFIRSTDSDIMHRRGTTEYKIFDAKNANLSTIDWAAKIVTVADRVNSVGGFFQTSDERKKTFIDDIRVDWERLKTLPKKYYTLTDDPENKKRIGTSAQKLMEIYPEAVSMDQDGFYAVDYAKLSVVALAAAVELEDRVRTLEDRLARLEEKLG